MGKMEELQAFMRGAGQGLSLGFSDEITAAGESALTDKTYEQALAESRAAYKEAEEQNPKSYMAGDYGSTIGLGLATGGSSLLAAGGVAGAKMLGRAGLREGLKRISAKEAAKGLGRVSADSAATGVIEGLGRSEATTGEGLAKDAALGGTIGAVAPSVFAGAGKAIGQGVKNVKNKLNPYQGKAPTKVDPPPRIRSTEQFLEDEGTNINNYIEGELDLYKKSVAWELGEIERHRKGMSSFLERSYKSRDPNMFDPTNDLAAKKKYEALKARDHKQAESFEADLAKRYKQKIEELDDLHLDLTDEAEVIAEKMQTDHWTKVQADQVKYDKDKLTHDFKSVASKFSKKTKKFVKNNLDDIEQMQTDLYKVSREGGMNPGNYIDVPDIVEARKEALYQKAIDLHARDTPAGRKTDKKIAQIRKDGDRVIKNLSSHGIEKETVQRMIEKKRGQVEREVKRVTDTAPPLNAKRFNRRTKKFIKDELKTLGDMYDQGRAKIKAEPEGFFGRPEKYKQLDSEMTRHRDELEKTAHALNPHYAAGIAKERNKVLQQAATKYERLGGPQNLYQSFDFGEGSQVTPRQ